MSNRLFLFILGICIAFDTISRYFIFKTNPLVAHYIETGKYDLGARFLVPIILIGIILIVINNVRSLYALLFGLILGLCNTVDLINDNTIHNPFLFSINTIDTYGFNFADFSIVVGIFAFVAWLLYDVVTGQVAQRIERKPSKL